MVWSENKDSAKLADEVRMWLPGNDVVLEREVKGGSEEKPVGTVEELC